MPTTGAEMLALTLARLADLYGEPKVADGVSAWQFLCSHRTIGQLVVRGPFGNAVHAEFRVIPPVGQEATELRMTITDGERLDLFVSVLRAASTARDVRKD